MTLGPTRQLLNTGERLLQLSKQLQQTTSLDGLTHHAYADLTIDPLTRLEHQLQGVPIEDNAIGGPPERLVSSPSPWGSAWPQSPSLPVNPRFNPTNLKPSPGTGLSLSSQIKQASFSETRQSENNLSPSLYRPNNSHHPTIADPNSSLATATNPTAPKTLQISILKNRSLHGDSHSPLQSTSSSLPTQSARFSVPTPHPFSSTVPKGDSPPTQTTNPQATAAPITHQTELSPSPLRMVQSPNKLASILKTQLTPFSTPSQPASPQPVPPSSPQTLPPITPTPPQSQAISLSTTETRHTSLAETPDHPLTSSSLPSSPLTSFSPSSPQTPDPLTLDTLLDAVAERLEFDRLRLYGTSSL